jgi:hypothetical protein
MLERLLLLSDDYRIPLTLAVIPEKTGQALAQRLSASRYVSVAVHGWSHANHAPAGEKKQELGNHRHQQETLAELSRGFTTLSQLHGQRFVPLLVPPWNRISPQLIENLSAIGFKGVSTFGDEKFNNLPCVNTHVDIIDWKGTRLGYSVSDVESQIIKHIETGRSVIGILTHHLVHDEGAWQVLEALFRSSVEQDSARWVSIVDLL